MICLVKMIDHPITKRNESPRGNQIKIRNADGCIDLRLGILSASTQRTMLTRMRSGKHARKPRKKENHNNCSTCMTMRYI